MPWFRGAIVLSSLTLVLLVGQSQSLAKGDSQKLLDRADEIAKSVAKLRGLKLLKKIDRGVMTKAQIKKRILKLIDEEYTPAELAAESLTMKRFGLLPEKSDFVAIMVNLLQEQIAGFYDQHEKKLYVAGWAPMGGEMLMAHEIDHALQDQHFDLVKFMATNKKNGDSMAARQALVEGDGMALMMEFQMASMGQAPPWGNPAMVAMIQNSMESGTSAMSKAPFVMRESLVFPYSAGLSFVVHFRKHHGWETIDAIYKKPPLSTEQILHPKKYESYELPISITASKPAVLKAYFEKHTTVQGERGIELFLRQHGVATERALVAAAGWGGDRTVVYARKGHKGSKLAGSIGVSMAAWDTDDDAREYFETLESALAAFGGKPRQSRKDKVLQFAIGADLIVAEHRGNQVLLVIAAPKKDAEAIRSEIWSTWRVAKAAIN